MDGRRVSSAGSSSIPQMRSGIPRPGGAAANTNGAESAIPRPSSRMGGNAAPSAGAGARVASGPMGSYRPSSAAGRSSVGGAASGPSSMLLRQAPASAAPASRTYSGLANRISTLAPRPLDPNTSVNMLGDDVSSASILLDTSLGGAALGGGHKRTVSAAGLGDESVSSSSAAIKRPHLRKLSMDGTSPFLLQAQTDLHPAATPRPESPAYEIAVLRTHYDQQLLAEGRKYKKLEQDYEAKCKELDRFNRQRVELLDEWDKQQESSRAKEAEWTAKRQSLEDEVVRLRSSNLELSHRNDELASNSSTELAELRGRVTSLESDLAKARAEAQAATIRAKTAEDEVGANKAELEDLQNALEDEQRMRMQQLDEARLGGAEEGKKIADELARQTTHLRKLEAENAHLVAENGRLSHQASNVELLKEEKRSLEVKTRTLDALRDQLAAAETLVTELQEKESHWDTMLRTGLQADVDAAFAAAANTDGALPSITAPEVIDRTTLPRYLSTLRGTLSGLEARCRALQATVEKLRVRNVTLEEEAKDVDAKDRKTTVEMHELQTSLSRAQKTEARLNDEIGRLKAMLSSYEQEEQVHNSASYSAAHAQRISLLEAELEKAQAENGRLSEEVEQLSQRLAEKESKGEEEPSDLEGVVEQLSGKKATLEGKVSEMEASLTSLTKELESLSKENETLWLRVGRGEFDQERQRCLVLASNPVSYDLTLRRANLDALKAENASLLARVEELSSHVTSSSPTTAAGSEALVPQSTLDNLRSELHDLQTSIAAKDKSLLRLKQVFSAKANEFREAIQSLFGYKVKFLENGKVKLTSIHNRSATSTSLVFESEEGNVGKMKLMGEAVKVKGLVDVEGLKEYWLAGGRQSVPCFLAALNLELYEGCTQAVRRGRFDGEGEIEDE